MCLDDDYDLEEVMANVRLADSNYHKSPEVQQKVTACLGDMRSLHGAFIFNCTTTQSH